MWLLAEISNIFFVNFNSSSRLQFHVDLISTTYTHELGLECKFGPLNFSKLLFFFWFEAHEDDLQRSRSQVTGFLCFLFPSPYVRCRLTISLHISRLFVSQNQSSYFWHDCYNFTFIWKCYWWSQSPLTQRAQGSAGGSLAERLSCCIYWTLRWLWSLCWSLLILEFVFTKTTVLCLEQHH